MHGSCIAWNGRENPPLCRGSAIATFLPSRVRTAQVINLVCPRPHKKPRSTARYRSQLSCLSIQFSNLKVSKEGSEIFTLLLKNAMSRLLLLQVHWSHWDHQFKETPCSLWQKREGSAGVQHVSAGHKVKQKTYSLHYHNSTLQLSLTQWEDMERPQQLEVFTLKSSEI